MTQISVIFLLFNAQGRIQALLDSVLQQRHSSCQEQSEWLDVLFMDDGSVDGTLAELHAALEKAGFPSHINVVANDGNLGLSATLNKAFGLIRTPYALTCHLDVLFGCDDYVASMLSLMESHPRAGAITGQPRLPPAKEISMAEKFNLISNLMDIFPASGQAPLVPVGFAEGRCDIFRVEALRTVGFWDRTLQFSGEDQILAARLRQNGYEIYQAPHLPYYLSVSDQQNSLRKLLGHAHLFGRTQPYILFSGKAAIDGGMGNSAGSNRSLRMLFRMTHLLASLSYLLAFICLLCGAAPLIAAGPVAAVALLKILLLRRHLHAVPIALTELPLFIIFVPLQDICYAAGFLEGTWNCFFASKSIIR